MTPERFLEIVREHLEHDCSEAAHMVLSDRIYEESGGDELLAAGMRWHGLHYPENTMIWTNVVDMQNLVAATRKFGEYYNQEIERTLTQKGKTGKVEIVK